MKAILDTHAFLWALAGDARMSRHARDTFAGPTGL
jgi:PIN domain nuclease of toxin-antitoxin system